MHRIEARRRRRLAAAAAIPEQVKIYVAVVGSGGGAVDVIARGTMVLLLMSKWNNKHGLWHSCLRRLHEEPRGIFDPLQICRGILGHVGQPGQ